MSVQTKGRLLEAAKRVFSERGYFNAHISHIIDEAGVARGTFYLYFKGKEDIFRELLRGVVEELRKRIKTIDPSHDPAPQIIGNVASVIEFALSDRELATIVLRRNCDPELFGIIGDFFEELIDLIKLSLDKGVALGLVRECDTELLARAVVGALKEVILGLLEREDVDVVSVATELVELGLGGVWKKEAGR